MDATLSTGTPSPLGAGVPDAFEHPRGLFCNRTLNLRNIEAIGYDMDYTLVHYRVELWEERAYSYVKSGLAAQGWPVDDLAAALISVRYHQLRAEQHEPVEALQIAQLWLRSLSYGALLDFLADLQMMLDRVGGDAATVERLRRSLKLDTEQSIDRASKLFLHPKFWGAFSIIGG